LYADTKKGNRPSFIMAAKPENAIKIYNSFIKELQTHTKTKIKTGKFAADMKINLINDGPVTIIYMTFDGIKGGFFGFCVSFHKYLVF